LYKRINIQSHPASVYHELSVERERERERQTCISGVPGHELPTPLCTGKGVHAGGMKNDIIGKAEASVKQVVISLAEASSDSTAYRLPAWRQRMGGGNH
jgi:hypothetical protein